MRVRYSKPNQSKPFINDHVEIKTRRVGSVYRVYAKIVRGFDSIEKGHRDFTSYADVLALFATIGRQMPEHGWTRR
jgi:hypothetical protein